MRRFEDIGVTRMVFEIGSSPLEIESAPAEATIESLTANLKRVAERVEPN